MNPEEQLEQEEVTEEEAAAEAISEPEVVISEPEVVEEAAPEGSGEAAEESPLEKLTRERDEYLDLAHRARAEFDNYRRRAARDAIAAEQRGKAALAKTVLPAIDNLERALLAAGVELEPSGEPGEADEASREVSAHEALAAGVALIHSEIAGALRAAGIEVFAPDGERFDPTSHEALSARPALSGEEPGVVVETLQRGYRIGDTLIRPARVVVTS
ncbi:MAG: nucleotide exchange factor GrpE [Actinomycetota bacterium]|nr:nucleotide exchange factor GrpE [Actinomycetota bacterium]